ncbi:MAG: homoserine O-acetyltransferase [Bacteroidota bacterium]
MRIIAKVFYSWLSMVNKKFTYPQTFPLESGQSLPGFELSYATLGNLNEDKSNVVWVCHAFTGHPDVSLWWNGLFGPGRFFDPEKYFIICANMLGSCYGSTGPLSINPETNEPWYLDFPLLTNRDMVRSFDLLRKDLGLEKVHILIGGSMGGQHVLEWAIQQADVFEYIMPIATNAVHSPWGIAFNETQRMAIEADRSWGERQQEAGLAGMKAARAAAMLSYRSYEGYEVRQKNLPPFGIDNFRASSYQQYMGEKLAKRFNAFTYWYLSKAMDSQNLARGRVSLEAALGQIQAKTLTVAIDSDILFPPAEQKFIAKHIPHAEYVSVSSLFGHDGFLVENEAFVDIFRKFLAKEQSILN